MCEMVPISRLAKLAHNLVSAVPSDLLGKPEYSWSINNSMIFTINKLRKGTAGLIAQMIANQKHAAANLSSLISRKFYL